MTTATEWFNSLDPKPKYFTAKEFLYRGASDARLKLNTDPPSSLWPNGHKLIKLLDEFRGRIGAPIKLLSVYRSPAYNAAIDGATQSYHMRFMAADFQVLGKGLPADWAVILKAMRALGIFNGGIGIYDNFVHVDVRGTTADWDFRRDKSYAGRVLTLPGADTTPTPTAQPAQPAPIPVSTDLPPAPEHWFIRLLRLLGFK